MKALKMSCALICACLTVMSLNLAALAVAPPQPSVLTVLAGCSLCRNNTPHTIYSSSTYPTCTSSGLGQLKCTVCGNITARTSIPALGHSWRETSRIAATCTSPGLIESTCSRCKEIETETLSAFGHEWSETGRTDPTCTAAGTIYETCSRCSEIKTTPIPALGGDHTWTETSRISATCTTAGSVSFRCSKCSETKTESLSVLDHDWKETGRIPAACLTPGSVDYVCSRCTETKTETIPQLGTSHIWTVSGHTDPACTSDGVTGYIIDEAGIEYNNRSYKSVPPESIYFYKYHRHYKVSVDVFSQSYDDMDVTLRRLAQNFYVVRRSLVPFCIAARRIRRRVGVDEQTKQITDLYAMGIPVLDTKRIFSPPLWKLFNSYSRKELPQKDWPLW